ncbi:MAG: glycosyltransferase [Actinomycetota bacterium]|nr:glycosyltransferase [Actinomycetota bacterium]
MRLSVALCTLDGERWIGDLLESIRRQWRLPDQLVVGDDGSTDGTLALVEDFAASVRFPVRVERWSHRRGVTGNFSATMSLCDGDVIVLCDQDDVWVPEKLAELERAFVPGVAAAFSDAELVDADGTPLGATLWAALHFNEAAQAAMRTGAGLAVLLKRNVVTGATLAVSSGVASAALPFPAHGLHDVWLAWVAACLGPVRPIPTALIRYRQHGGNLVGAPRRRLRDRLAHRITLGDVSALEAAHLQALVERLRSRSHPVEGALLELVEEKIAHLQVRSGLPGRRCARVVPVLHEVTIGRYARYSRGWESVAYDLLFASGRG